jgi:uncharacterized protein (TIGR04255 family)
VSFSAQYSVVGLSSSLNGNASSERTWCLGALNNNKANETRDSMTNYKNPPVTEVLCEFQFVPDRPLDITVMGLLYDRIKDEFPVKQQQVGVAPPQKAETGLGLAIMQRMQFFRLDKSALVQATPDTLTVNHLKPYASWEEFAPLVLKCFDTFRQIINPKGLKRIAVAYVNKFEFSDPMELKDCFNFRPLVPEGLPEMFDAISISIEIPYEEGQNRLGIILHSVPSQEPNMFSFVLNLDCHSAPPESAESVALDNVSEWIELAHDRIKYAFDKCLTAKCKASFGGG